MSRNFKPMLSCKCPPKMTFEEFLSKIRFPVYATPKIDGIRCIKINGRALTRTLKSIPNHHVRQSIELLCPDYLDGELTCGDNFQAVTSGIMTYSGTPHFTYYVFGCGINDTVKPYREVISEIMTTELPDFCVPLYPMLCESLDDLLFFEERCLNQGAEGVMTRPPTGLYKYGRSTLNEQYLVAIKRFTDAEGKIVGFNELFSNGNEATRDNLGYVERSSFKDGLRPMNTLGSLEILGADGVQFKLGTGIGLTAKLRKQIWLCQDRYLGKTVTYKEQLHGKKDKPRIPIFKGFRED